MPGVRLISGHSCPFRPLYGSTARVSHPTEEKTQNPCEFCMSRGDSLPSSWFAVSGERCPPRAQTLAHPSPAPCASQGPGHLPSASGRHVALASVGWSQNRRCERGGQRILFSCFFGYCLPIHQSHALLSPHTATAVDFAPISHLHQRLFLPHRCFPFLLVSAAPPPL